MAMENGITLKTLVAQHLRAWLDYSNSEGKLYFWRTKNGLEVDFIVYGEIGFYAVEVKNAATIHPRDLKGLIEFKHDYPKAECLLLYRGKEVLKRQDVICFPVDKFLLSLQPDKSLLEKRHL